VRRRAKSALFWSAAYKGARCSNGRCERRAGEAGVSVAFDFGSAFEEDDVCAGFVGGESCYQAGVAATGNYHVVYVERGGVGRGDHS
jgi:hypothetical protein